MIALLLLLAQAPAAPPVADPAPATVLSLDPQVRLAEIRAAIDSGRLVQADMMLGPLPAAPSALDYRLYGDLRMAQQRYVEAAQMFLRLEQMEPQNGYATSRLAMALMHLGRMGDAEARLRKAVELPDADWQTWDALGVALDSRQAWAESRQVYTQALRMAPDQPRVLNNFAYSLIVQGRSNEAKEMISKAHALAPDDPRIAVNSQIADGMAGIYPKKRGSGETDAQFAARLNNAGYGAMLAGNLPKARSLFARAIKESDTYYEAAERNLARVEGQLGR